MGPKMTSRSHQIASREHPKKTTKNRDQKDPLQQTENIGPFWRQGTERNNTHTHTERKNTQTHSTERKNTHTRTERKNTHTRMEPQDTITHTERKKTHTRAECKESRKRL